jgi:lipopolysaccharide export system permease protein
MMPIIWKYLLSQYAKVLILCILAFISILLTTRLDEIAHFATLGPEGLRILWFTLHQIPYVLPIAIPLSALISSIILIQQLSSTHELTAMRACGLSLREILSPIIIAGSFLTLASFLIVSEVATSSHLKTSQIKNELRSINPLLLLHNKHLMKVKGFYFDTMGASKMGETASQIILASPNKHNNRINVLLAENLTMANGNFQGQGVTLLTSLNEDSKERFDHLMVENITETATSSMDFSQMLQKKVWTLNNDHLKLPMLLSRLREQQQDYYDAKQEGQPESTLKQIQRGINRCYAEIVRRISAAFAAFSFTFMGAAFGISISRQQSNRGIAIVILLATLYLVCFFSAKGIEHLLLAASLLYILPHVLITASSLFILHRATKGIE